MLDSVTAAGALPQPACMSISAAERVNRYAATAGTVSGSSNYSDAFYDICPAGWRLPIGGSSGEFQALYTQYNSNALMRASMADSGAAFTLSGGFSSGNPSSSGSSGRYLSSAWYSNNSIYALTLTTSGVTPGNSLGRGGGGSIRCVRKAPMYSLTINYGTGITDVSIDGVTVSNGGTIQLEEGRKYIINSNVNNNYSFNNWTVSSGNLGYSTTQTTSYIIGSSNATLTASASFGRVYIQNLPASSCTTTARTVYDIRLKDAWAKEAEVYELS